MRIGLVMTRRKVSWVSLVVLTACGGPRGQASCGIAAFAGPSMLLEEFTKPGLTLAALPKMPEIIPVRLAGGPVYRGIVGKTDSSWIIGVDGPLPGPSKPGYGVLLDDPAAGADGIILYEGVPIPGAPILGTVNAGIVNVPLLGVRATVAMFQDPGCPLFPDSLRRR